jgi:hypothetical protein
MDYLGNFVLEENMTLKTQNLASVPNILLSTTRMWNPGDDFIAFGVRHLLEEIFPRFNPIAYNRNPELHLQRTRYNSLQYTHPKIDKPFKIDLLPYLEKTLMQYDNSWRPSFGLDSIDYCLFAGSPEWYGRMHTPLTTLLENSDIPVAYLGIGSHEGIANHKYEQFSQIDRKLLERSTLITVRDSLLQNILSPASPLLLPCPALFSAKNAQHRQPQKRLRIALSTQPCRRMQSLHSEKNLTFSLNLFKELAKRHDCEIICHYIDEIPPIKDFGLPIRFSYDPRDYEQIYNEFDLTVTTRVHGAGLCASLGVPGYIFSHSTRSDTGKGFLSEVIDVNNETVDGVLNRIETFDVSARSAQLIKHKEIYKARFVELLRGWAKLG